MPSGQLATTPITRKTSRWGGFLTRRRKSPKVEGSFNDQSDMASPEVRCCLPRRKVVRPTRTVHFAKTVETNTTGASNLMGRVGTPKLTRRRSRSVKRSESRRSFYSVVSTYSAVKRIPKTDDDDDDKAHVVTRASSLNSDNDDSIELETAPSLPLCACNFAAHTLFDSKMPIITPSGVEPGSYDELLIHANAQLGNWITLLDRSDSLDPQMIHVGISKMKRMVMNRLAIPFTAVLEENDTVLHCWITTPVGAKHTNSGLKGQETQDKDKDLGDWTAKTSMVDYPVDIFCTAKTVRAMQMKRSNPALGTAYETRICLPDAAEGRVMLYNLTIEPGNGADRICVNRIYKFVSP